MLEEATGAEGQGATGTEGSTTQQATQSTGSESGDWRSSIPAELREAPQLKDVKDIGSLAKQFVDQQRFLGSSIRIPGEDAGTEGRKEFLAKLQKHAPELIIRPDATNEQTMAEFWEMVGVPKDHADYDIEEGLQVDEAWLASTKEIAKKYGLTKEAFRRFAKDKAAAEANSAAESERIMAEDMKGLQTEWGLSTEARINDVKKFAEVMQFPAGFQDALKSGRVGSEWLRTIHNIVQQFGGMSEGKTVAFQPGGSIPDSPTELKAKIAEIEANPAFLDQRNPQNKGLIAKRVELFKQLNAAAKTN